MALGRHPRVEERRRRSRSSCDPARPASPRCSPGAPAPAPSRALPPAMWSNRTRSRTAARPRAPASRARCAPCGPSPAPRRDSPRRGESRPRRCGRRDRAGRGTSPGGTPWGSSAPRRSRVRRDRPRRSRRASPGTGSRSRRRSAPAPRTRDCRAHSRPRMCRRGALSAPDADARTCPCSRSARRAHPPTRRNRSPIGGPNGPARGSTGPTGPSSRGSAATGGRAPRASPRSGRRSSSRSDGRHPSGPSARRPPTARRCARAWPRLAAAPRATSRSAPA